MPEPGSAAYLLGHFWQVGPTLGEGAITSGELRHYQENMGITLSPWECKTLHRLSVEFVNESHKATKRDCPPPFAGSSDASRLRQIEMDRNLDTFFS